MNNQVGTQPAASPKSVWTMVVKYFSEFKILKETRSEYWGTQVVNFIDCTLYFGMLAIVSVFLSEDIGLSDTDAGYSITVFTTATTIFLFFSGMITDWLGIRMSIYVAMIALLLLRLGVVVVGLVESIPYRGWICTLLLFFMAPFMAMIQTVFQAANKRFTTEKSRSAGFSLWYLFMNIGAACGGFLVDIVRKGLHLPNVHVFSFGVIAAILCSLATFLMIRREGQLLDAEEKEKKEEFTEQVVVKKRPLQIAAEVIKESAFWRLAVLVALLLGVRAVFAYMYLLMPKYWLRTIGPDAAIGTLQAINPILIIIGIILFIPLVNKFNLFKMLVYGAMVSAASLLVLVLPWQWFSANIGTAHYLMSIFALVVLSVGEVIWSPKLNEYTAEIAPPGQEGTYLGLSLVPWFLAKTVVSVLSGHMLLKWCPEGIGQKMVTGSVPFWESPAAMWLVLGIYAFIGLLIALSLRGWLTKGTKASAAFSATN